MLLYLYQGGGKDIMFSPEGFYYLKLDRGFLKLGPTGLFEALLSSRCLPGVVFGLRVPFRLLCRVPQRMPPPAF